MGDIIVMEEKDILDSFIPIHKRFTAKMKITAMTKHVSMVDLEEEYEEL